MDSMVNDHYQLFSMMMRYFRFQPRGKGDLDPDPDSDAFKHHDRRNDQLAKLQEKVFQSPVILEVILMHCLCQRGSSRDGGGFLCTREAKNLRLVSKAWLIQINCLFQRHGEPLVFLNGKNLRLFLKIKDIHSWATPPISLSIGFQTLLTPNLCKDLNKFFATSYLVAKITVLRILDSNTIKGGPRLEEFLSFPDFPSEFRLTNLRKIWLKQLGLFGEVPESKRMRFGRLEEFVGQIVDQSEKLEVFKFEGNVWRDCPPGQYKGLILPGTVTRVQLDTRMNLGNMLGMNSGGGWRVLEGITTLKLSVTTGNLFGEGEMEGILEGVRFSLEHLELDFRNMVGLDGVEIVLKIPVMVSLKRLRIGGKEWRVERSLVLNGLLGDRFPRLEQLEFSNGYTDELLLNDWCGGGGCSVFGGTKRLTLKLVPEGIGRGGTVGMSEEKMRKILKTFPNVEKLWMQVLDVGDMEGVRFMFGELGGQLRSLHLEFKGFLEREEEIEGILIGGDVEMVRRLKRKRRGGKLWRGFLEGGNGGYKSLRDLVNLEELVLVGYAWKIFQNGWFWRLVRRPNMLSFTFGCEVLFKGAFMRMPKLRRLVLLGGFKPGEGMVEKWRKQGGGGIGRRREVEFRRRNGIWDRLWWMGSWRWYALWVICWALIIFWDGN